MNFQTKEGYRLNVAMIIFNEDKKVLFCLNFLKPIDMKGFLKNKKILKY